MGVIPWVLVSGWVYFDYGGCCRVLSRRSLLSTLIRSFLYIFSSPLDTWWICRYIMPIMHYGKDTSSNM